MRYLFFFIALLASCTTQNRQPAWPQGVAYEVFVLAYADSNGDGKGDLPGLTSKLDYIQSLGVKAIWLMPVMPSPSYHKYDVTDYKNIHPDYGSLNDFSTFVNEAQKRNMAVLVDLVMNHTSKLHPWFVEASKNNPRYRDYYVWANKDSIQNQLNKKSTSFDSDNITQWHAVRNDTLAEHYYGFFSSHMPDLNMDNEQVRAEWIDIATFWLQEMNVDGFRLDAARHIYPDDRSEANHNFWTWFKNEVTKIKPTAYLVGEVWAPTEEVAPYLKGLDAAFNFDLARSIVQVIQLGKDTAQFVRSHQQRLNAYRNVNPHFSDATILSNHDQNRIISQLNSSVEKAKLAASMLLTLPGTPYIYYGEEIGMAGTKPDENIREPFLWGDASQTSWKALDVNTPDRVKSVSGQTADPNSVLNHYKSLIQFRNGSEALTRGELELADLSIAELISFQRVAGDEKLLIIHNLSDVEITFSLPVELQLFKTLRWKSSDQTQWDDALRLPAFSSVILKSS